MTKVLAITSGEQKEVKYESSDGVVECELTRTTGREFKGKRSYVSRE